MGFAFEEFPDADYYRSDLRAVLRYVRKLNAYVKTWDDTIAEIREAIKDLDDYGEDILDLQDRMSKIEPLVYKLKSDTEFILQTLSEVNDWKELTDAKLIVLGHRIDRLRTYVDDMDNAIMTDYNGKFTLFSLKMNQMKAQLLSLINGLIERIEYLVEHFSSDVLDPIEDRRLTFDKNNMNVYNRLNNFCITEEDFSELGLTEQEFEDIGFTQMQYALDSARVLRTYFIFAPISGIRKSHEQAIAEVVTFLCSTMTENQFTALNLTEDEFEALNLTHEEYLRYNSSHGGVFVDPSNSGLTEEQYQHLGV